MSRYPHSFLLAVCALLIALPCAVFASVVGTQSFCDGSLDLCQRTCDQAIRNELKEIDAFISTSGQPYAIQLDPGLTLDLEPKSLLEELAEDLTDEKEACYADCAENVPSLCHRTEESIV